ncbi:adenine-specific DNA-methyltransferase [Brassicibacter mesophilus]
MMKYQIKKLKTEIRKILSSLEIENIDEYMTNMKSILYFIGKAVLAISMYGDTKDESTYIEIIDNSLINKLPDVFIDFEKQFGYQNYLTENRKIELIKILLEMDKDTIENFSIGELYEELITSREKKYLGQVYTPNYIVKYMISSGIRKEDIIKNPYYRVIDPACGGGFFLIEAYNRIKNIIENNYEQIVSIHTGVIRDLEQGLHLFILKNNIWGSDIDSFAVYMTITSLLMRDTFFSDVEMNIFSKDILMEDRGDLTDLENYNKEAIFKGNSFNLVIGNPPYIGHKKIDKNYRKKLEMNYSDVYYDKADISYCFFKKGHDLLCYNGKLVYITSRYFQEAPSALGLRKLIKEKFTIDNIIDFYGKNVFKGIGISPVILECTKQENKNCMFNVYRLSSNKENNNSIIEIQMKSSERLLISQDELKDNGWIFTNNTERKLFNKINELGEYRLDELCDCNQGIITGCDKAFIVDKNMIVEEGLENDIIKPWIKNSEVKKYRPPIASKYILYTDKIKNIENYGNIIKHITPYKKKLGNRRECKKGAREWYQLQWGRNIEVFNRTKIIFPFKSSTNEFTLSYDEICCSADIYIISMKKHSVKDISLEYVLGFLNSSIFEFYFKCVAKKLNDKLYEYYPNKLMNLRIRVSTDNNRERIEDLVTSVIKKYSILKTIESNKYENKDAIYKQRIISEINESVDEINKSFYKLYGISDEEIATIESKITF